MKTLPAIALAAMMVTPLPALAGDMDVIKSFYADLLTTPADATPEAVRSVVAEDWESIPTPRGGPGAEGLHKTLGAFGSVLPDLTWEPQEILGVESTLLRKVATGLFLQRSSTRWMRKGGFIGLQKKEACRKEKDTWTHSRACLSKT